MKFKGLSIIFSLIIFVGLAMSSCDKEEENDPAVENPTNGKTTAVFNSNKTYGTMTDQDGNVYKTITIGTQTWMAENLRTTKFRDGSAIPNVTDGTAWGALITAAYCNYENTNNDVEIATYGRLYNWYAVADSRNIAPAGWHVPSDAEWTTLTTYLGGRSVAGGKMKETGTTHWESPNTGATNESGFTALPAGDRSDYFEELGYFANWWSFEASVSDGYGRYLVHDYAACDWGDYNKEFGLSVRLLKD